MSILVFWSHCRDIQGTVVNQSSVVLVCLMMLRDWYVDLSCPPNPLASLLGGGEVWSLGGVWGMYNVPTA